MLALLPLQPSEKVVDVPLWTLKLFFDRTQSERRDAEGRKISKKKMFLLLIVLFLVTVSAALGQDVRYNFDKDTDFAKFKSYKWVVLKDAPEVDNLRDKQIKETVDAELATKSLTKTDTDAADLYIGYQAGIGTEKQFTSYNTDWGYGPG